jgi:DNA-binding transcriptional MerR regulator
MSTLAYGGANSLDDFIAVPLARAAHIAQVAKGRLWYWDRTNIVRPTIKRTVNRRETVRLYTFDDLVALYVVAHLRRGFSLQHIRQLVAHLRRSGYETPLTELTFGMQGGEIYFRHPDGNWEGDRVPGQLVIREVLNLDLVREVIRQGVARPANDRGKPDSHRGHLGGKLVFAGTRIPVEIIQRRLGRGATDEEILAAYPALAAEDIALARESAPLG